MRLQKSGIILATMICVIGGSVYAWDCFSSKSAQGATTTSIPEDGVVVYDDGEWTATISKEQYDALTERDKENFDSKYKKIIELMEKHDKDN